MQDGGAPAGAPPTQSSGVTSRMRQSVRDRWGTGDVGRGTGTPGRMTAFLSLALALAACNGGGGGGTGITPAPCTFTNPVATGADPWVVRHEEAYYSVQSRDNGIWVSRSEDLTSAVSTGVRVWLAPTTGWNRTNVWAPELHRIGDRWYIYYAAGSAGPPFVHQRSGVLESVGDDAQGAYVDKGMLYTGDDVAGQTDPKWAIDVTVAELGGQRYAVWSGWEENTTETDRTPQHLYIATMTNPWTIGSDRVKLSSPTAPWEIGTELDLQEGPEFLVHDGDVFIVYSTRESWLPAYRLGQLRLTPGADPMDPASWTKSGPVFAGTTTVHGTGHASFTTSPDGTEDWIVYHSKRTTTPGWDRVIRMQEFTWNADGSPSFGTPVEPNSYIALPSGQCQ